jgi:hypothetical protein
MALAKLFAVMIIVLLLSIICLVVIRSSNTTQAIAIPSYFQPGASWTQMEEASPVVSMTIVNPSNGPGSLADVDHVDQVKKSQGEAGLTVLGYVPTSYGARDTIGVKEDIDRYYSWYGVDGIFFDEASTECSKVSSYYEDLYGYVKAKGGKAIVALNPGIQTNECYMAVSDIIVNFEDTYVTYANSYSAPDWVSNYSHTRFWHLIHTTPYDDMKNAVSLSKQRNAGWVYVTPDIMPNPWDTLPEEPYWSQMLQAVEANG